MSRTALGGAAGLALPASPSSTASASRLMYRRFAYSATKLGCVPHIETMWLLRSACLARYPKRGLKGHQLPEVYPDTELLVQEVTCTANAAGFVT